MIPTWLTVVSWISLGVALLCALAILYDVFVRGYRQHALLMEAVWPLNALYFGPLALWAYRRWGRPNSGKWQEEHGDPPENSLPAATATGATHCGGACMLGHLIGVWLVFLLGLTIAGLSLLPMYIAIFALTFAFMAAFEHSHKKSTIGGSPLGKELMVAILAVAAVSTVAFEVGMFAWMAVMQLVLFPVNALPPVTLAYWALMQIGFVVGFLTSYPAEWWLVRRGTKEAM